MGSTDNPRVVFLSHRRIRFVFFNSSPQFSSPSGGAQRPNLLREPGFAATLVLRSTVTAEWGRNGKCYLNRPIHSVGLVTLDLFPLSFFAMLYLTPSRFYARLTLASVTILCATGSTSASSDAPSSSEFRRRSDHGSVVVGDFVYIEGGRIRSLNHNNDARAPVNKTLAIDLRQSWTNETVQFIETSKGDSPALTYPSLWPDGNGSFYMWAGAAATSARTPALGLWKFTTDGDGGGGSGEWAQQSPRNATEFNQLTRPVAGYSGVVAGAGFYLGGQGTTYTDDVEFEGVDTHAAVPVPGLVSYNFTTRAWRNASAQAFSTHGTQTLGRAAGVPFGAGGLLVALGGQKGSRTSTASTIGFLDFGVVDVYDPAASSWHKQAATGDVPSPRVAFCMAGAQGRNGSYELFVFGGARRNDGEAYSDVYVLSLPAFRWFKGQDADAPRFFHSCEVVGNRQLLSIGGFNDNDNTSARYSGVDPWKQGLGVFDMTELEWSDGYRADALVYESPQVVKDWYNEGYVHPFPFEMASAHQSSFQQRSA